MHTKTPSLEEVRARIDAIDSELLRLVDERAAMARAVADAKRAAGEGDRFALRPAREAALMRRLLGAQRPSASDALIVRIWRELVSDSLSRQGPFELCVWGGADLPRIVELARAQFGAAPPMARATRPEEALEAAKTTGGVAVLALAVDNAWWGRLLAEPKLTVFAALPSLAAWGPTGALAVGDVAVEPTGDDVTFWVTDATAPAAALEELLGRDGVAGQMIAAAGGLKLFSLPGFYQRDDERLARAPGRLSGVIGASAQPFDL